MTQNDFFHQTKINLPLIHKLIESYKIWQGFLSHFPKTSRATLGAKIDRQFIKVFTLSYQSYFLKPKSKLPLLKKASFELDCLKFFLRVAWEIEALDHKKYALISKNIDVIGKMIGGWINYLKRKLPRIS